MECPLVSIIMANYNGERFIARTIESVLQQSYRNFEFIIIDDASTDHSREIIDSYTDARIRKYYLNQNEHMCYCFNYGLAHGNGAYYARIDSDDTWEKSKLEKQILYLESNKTCGACFTQVRVIDEHNKELTEKDTDRVKLFQVTNRSRLEWLHYFFFHGSCLCHPSVVIRREIIDRAGNYNYSLRQIQDYELWLRIAELSDLYIIPEKLTVYRWFRDGSNASSPTVQTDNRSNYEFGYVIAHYFDRMSDEDFTEAFGAHFIYKGAKSKSELECEKIFLLLQPVFCGNYHRDRVLDMLLMMMQDDEKRLLLREKYHFTQKDFYELASQPKYYQDQELPFGSSEPESKVTWQFWLYQRLPRCIWKMGAGVYHLLNRKV